ncbi:Carboxypeptidase S [Lachnellula suecica]|uniref:Carboxypeptidase S n=1 Tax=Lachnellula suecica TaxID=602035 RepID=A0A8T9C1H7_9HELO|nr:Carboxypeptidase S [Lachnellula suecica]
MGAKEHFRPSDANDEHPFSHERSFRRQSPWRRFFFGALLTAAVVFQAYRYLNSSDSHSNGSKYQPQCPTQEVIGPKSHPEITEENVEKLFRSEAFKKLSAERLGGAVQIPTEDFDDMGPISKDKRWDVFYDLANYFKVTFPLLHKKLELEVVNSHALVYTWRGSDSSLEPIMLTGHQDVVPIAQDTLNQWKYPPFSGHFDGTYINGRGSHDCKNNVLAILASVTALLEADFSPRRTVVLGFGFDEEAPSNRFGAYQIGKHLEKVWGQDSFAILVDEGVVGIQKIQGRTFGVPQASEKGCMDAIIRVHVPGGHSSMAPPHTSIGIVAEAVTVLEAERSRNFPSRLTSNNPFYYQLHCAAEDPHTDISEELRRAVKDNKNDKVVDLSSHDFGSDILLRTSQAVTIFHAGSKSNALPAFAEALVNYRISNEESLADVQTALINTIKPLAKKHGLKFTSRDATDNSTSELPEYTLSLTWSRGLELSPVLDHRTDSWKYFSGVIKHVFDELGIGNDVLVAPSIAQGNTDTQYYWDLSSQIYRFGPLRAWHDEGWGGIHDVNERISLDAHLEAILFYHEFIRVFDEADLKL